MDEDLVHFAKRFQDEKISLDVTSKVAYHTLSGIAFLHACGFLHSDIKPDNILVKSTSNDYTFKIADLGTACAIGDTSNDYLQTSTYRAPEIILGYSAFNEKIDIWSLAITYFECISGDVLFYGENENDLIKLFVETLGIPPRDFLKTCKGYRNHFDRNGFIINGFDLRPLPLNRRLVEEFEISTENADAMCKLLLPMLEWHPDKRWSAKDLLSLYPN